MSGLDLYLSQRVLAMIFVYATAAGFCLGGVYDVLRIIRILCGDPIGSSAAPSGKRSIPLTILLFIEDVVFSIIASVTLILLLYYTNDGQLRAPAVIGMACGFFVYYHTVGRLVIRCAAAIVRWIKRACRMLWRVVTWPFVQLFKLLCTLMRFVWRKTAGKLVERRKDAQTDKRIRALIGSASSGFGMEPPDREKSNRPPA